MILQAETFFAEAIKWTKTWANHSSLLYTLHLHYRIPKTLQWFRVTEPILGGGFQYFLFSPLLGEMIQFDSYFSKGLKPPIRISIMGMS